MKPILHICLDFETAALGERAAILSVAAVPFLLPSDLHAASVPAASADPVPDVSPSGQSSPSSDLAAHYAEIQDYILNLQPFHNFVNATTCVMAGMDFDPDTIKFWANQPDEAKLQFTTDEYVSIRNAFELLVSWIADVKHQLGCDIRLWSQGTDFDIPKLRYCCTTILGMSEKDLPWKYYQVCDARSYVLENLALLFGRKEGNKAIYGDIPQDGAKDWDRHSALGDAQRTAYNVQQVNRMLMERLHA